MVWTVNKIQKGVLLSSSEAKYVAPPEGCRIIAGLWQVKNEMYNLQNPTVIYQDNNWVLERAIGGFAGHFSRRKHIDIIYHYVADMSRRGQIQILKVATEKMNADFLTKALEPVPVK